MLIQRRGFLLVVNVLAGLVISLTCHAQDWTLVARANGARFDLRTGSIEHTRSALTDQPIFRITIRVTESASGEVTFQHNYVPVTDCKVGYGELITTTMAGQYLHANEFVWKGGNVASTIATVICIAGAQSNANGIKF